MRLILIDLRRKIIFCEAIIPIYYGKLSLRAIIYFMMFHNEKLAL